MEYQLTCACGREIAISDGSAGTAIECVCGHTVKVPSLAALRSSAPVYVQPEVPPERGGFSGVQMCVLIIGLLVFGGGFFVGLIGAFAQSPLAGFGYLMAQGGQIWLLFLVVRECHTAAIFFALVIPFFTWYFAFQRLDIAKWPLLCNVGGLFLLLTAACGRL